jgi:hypothetical protein
MCEGTYPAAKNLGESITENIDEAAWRELGKYNWLTNQCLQSHAPTVKGLLGTASTGRGKTQNSVILSEAKNLSSM